MTSTLIIEFAEQRRRDLIAEAATYREARAVQRIRKMRRTRSGAAATHTSALHPVVAFRGWVAAGQL